MSRPLGHRQAAKLCTLSQVGLAQVIRCRITASLVARGLLKAWDPPHLVAIKEGLL